jgi:glutamate--cysteine ligase
MQGVCELLDEAESNSPYSAALNAQRQAVAQPEQTPSARVLAEIKQRGESFFAFAMRLSATHRSHFTAVEMSDERRQEFERMAAKSWLRQREIESTDEVTFDDYLRRYFQHSPFIGRAV